MNGFNIAKSRSSSNHEGFTASNASRNFKLPRANTLTARKTYGSIKRVDKDLGRDISKQDFQGAEYQSMRLEHDANSEAGEDRRLNASQMVKGESKYSVQKTRIAKREYHESKRQRASESRISRLRIKDLRKSKSHAKRESRRDDRIGKLIRVQHGRYRR